MDLDAVEHDRWVEPNDDQPVMVVIVRHASGRLIPGTA